MSRGIYVRKEGIGRFCSKAGCDRKHYGRGFCYNHYKQDERVRKGLNYIFRNENEIIERSDFAEIILRNRKRQPVAKALIDIKDLDMIRSFKWCLTDNGYAITNYYGTMIRMHVMIMGFIGIDHINCNRLDNRRSNLRKATYLENNRRAPRNRVKSLFRGVTKKTDSFYVRLKIGGEVIHIRPFKDPEEAAYVYDQVAMQLFGDFSLTNFEY